MTYEDAVAKLIYDDAEVEAIKLLVESLNNKNKIYYQQSLHNRAIIKAVRKINSENPDAESRRAGIDALTEDE